MAFWSSPASVEPKRQFRWILNVGEIPQWIIKSVTKPVLTTTDVAHKYFGYTYYYPGTSTWNTIDMVLVDPVNSDAVFTMATLLRQSGYKPPRNETESLVSISKDKANRAIDYVKIQQLNSEGNAIETWKLNNPFVTVADFGGTLSYDQDGLVDLKLTVRYDWATLETSNVGFGTKTVGAAGGIAVPPVSAGNVRWGGNDP
jgi:hypothetical protein